MRAEANERIGSDLIRTEFPQSLFCLPESLVIPDWQFLKSISIKMDIDGARVKVLFKNVLHLSRVTGEKKNEIIVNMNGKMGNRAQKPLA